MRTLAPVLTLAACLAFPAVALADIPPDSESDTDDPTTTGDTEGETEHGDEDSHDSDHDHDHDDEGDEDKSSGCSFTATEDAPLALGTLLLLAAGAGLRRRDA